MPHRKLLCCDLLPLPLLLLLPFIFFFSLLEIVVFVIFVLLTVCDSGGVLDSVDMPPRADLNNATLQTA